MYEGIKKALRPTQSKTAPLKTSCGKVKNQADREMGGTLFRALFQREHCCHLSTDSINHLSTMEELDAEPTLAELSKAINSLACSKAPGIDQALQDHPFTASI